MNLRAMQNDAAKQLLARPISQVVMEGGICKTEYISYMSDVYCYAQHSSQVIAMAGARLVASHPVLAEYLFKHAAEELGHEKWARSDLLDLGFTSDQIASLRPSSACLRMIGLEYLYSAHLNPIGLFGWMFVLESLGGKVGGGLAAAIDKTLGLDGKGMYFLNGHAEADTHHSEDLYQVIYENLLESGDQAAFERMYQESLDCYCRILDSAQGGGRPVA